MSVASYLAVCAIYRDEAPYLREWVEFHRLVGVERFFLYNNRSSDDHAEVLAPYVAQGIVTVADWPEFPGQVQAYEHCLAAHRHDSRWIAFIDVDEFLFSPTGHDVPAVLTEYEQWPGVGVNRLRFGTSGHRTKPEGLVIENYVHRARLSPYLIKSIVDPSRTERCVTVHGFSYRDGTAVDENHRPLDPGRPVPKHGPGAGRVLTETFTVSRLRINHYVTKSEAESAARAQRLQADTGRPRQAFDPVRARETFNKERDETILTYLPELRRRLAEPLRSGAPPN